MQKEHVPPTYRGDAFNCPHCGAFSKQRWYVHRLLLSLREDDWSNAEDVDYSQTSARCDRCGKESYWFEQKMLYPDTGVSPLPHPDMPSNVTRDYMEARDIMIKSPRGAAALLRLCVQLLMPHLEESGDNINNDIANLVERGLNSDIQKALDIVRVTGNNAVHPGQMDLRDDHETATALFGLINVIVDSMISQPKRIQELYQRLPQGARDAIDRRDQEPP